MKATSKNRIQGALWSVPVGLQLSIIYAVLLAIVIALLGWALYIQLDGFLIQNTADRLQRTIRERPDGRIEGRLDGGPPNTRQFFQGGAVPNPEQLAPFLVRGLSGPDVSVAVLNQDGQVITTTQSLVSSNPPSIPALPAGWRDKMADDAVGQWVVNDSKGERELVVVTPVTFRVLGANTDTQFFLEQVASLGAADAVLNQLRLYIALGILIGTAVGVAVGLGLTRVVLRPLDRMVGTAEAIAGGDLGRRLRLPSGRNEVARLGGSFDHMVDRLASALEAQRRFVADASHELRTPLTSLEGLSEMLLIGADRGDPGIVQRTVRAMHGELARLSRLVTDLLTLSRLDSTSLISPREVDPGKLLEEVATQMAPQAEAQEVNMVVDCTGELAVFADPDRLKQVILNLVDNALRYTPPGGQVNLSVSTDQTSNRALIKVSDTGPGISAEDLPHIFDRFYRGDLSRTRATGNSGLGLAIARAIVQAHGGTISVESAPGRGATFTVALPISHTHTKPPQPALVHSAN